MAAVAERLVGRADESGSLEAALSELGHRRSAILELVREPAIGKTRLLGDGPRTPRSAPLARRMVMAAMR